MKNMKNIKGFDNFISEGGAHHKYELHYTSDNVRGSLKGNDQNKLIDEVLSMKGVSEWSLFANKPGFHSTADEGFLLKWWDKGNNYWSNRSKKEPELLDKKYKA
jgi:hypothetical protein